ncbi:hypothetical protein J6590_072620 [Homalodisca vitripennis]|nr:hypothetical protein J6590_072620 [Homalodisca vitripennis]
MCDCVSHTYDFWSGLASCSEIKPGLASKRLLAPKQPPEPAPKGDVLEPAHNPILVTNRNNRLLKNLKYIFIGYLGGIGEYCHDLQHDLNSITVKLRIRKPFGGRTYTSHNNIPRASLKIEKYNFYLAASICVWGDKRPTILSITLPPDLGLLMVGGTEATPPSPTDIPRTATTIYCANRVNPFPGMLPFVVTCAALGYPMDGPDQQYTDYFQFKIFKLLQ